MLGGLRSAIINEVLQFVLIWAGAAMIPILGLIEAGGWTKLKAQIAVNVGTTDYGHMWSTLGSFKDNPMGVHWTGIVFGLGLRHQLSATGPPTSSSCSACLSANNLRAAQAGSRDRRCVQDGGSASSSSCRACWRWRC